MAATTEQSERQGSLVKTREHDSNDNVTAFNECERGESARQRK